MHTDDSSSPRETIPALLRALSAGERRLAGAVAQELGLGATDLLALGDLLGGEPLGPSELGRGLGLSSAAATGLADRLEALGHVERRRHPDDRRRLLLTPTPQARRQLTAQLAPVTAGIDELVAGLTADQRAAVAGFLSDLVSLYERQAADDRL